MNCRTIAFVAIVALTLFQMGHGLELIGGGVLSEEDIEFDPAVNMGGGVMNALQPRQCTGKFRL